MTSQPVLPAPAWPPEHHRQRSGRPRKAVLEGWQGDAYEVCGDTIRSDKGVHQQLLDRGFDLSLQTVTEFLDECCRSGVMVSDEEKYLSLALPQNPV